MMCERCGREVEGQYRRRTAQLCIREHFGCECGEKWDRDTPLADSPGALLTRVTVLPCTCDWSLANV